MTTVNSNQSLQRNFVGTIYISNSLIPWVSKQLSSGGSWCIMMHPHSTNVFGGQYS